MAMGWDDAAMIGAQLVGGLLGGGDEAQERASFRNQKVSGVSVDPRNLQAQAKVGGEDMLSALLDWLGQDITMKTTVQPLPSYVGGGLPMAISAPGKDQALANPGLLTTPGLKVQRRALDPRLNDKAEGSGGLFGNLAKQVAEKQGILPGPNLSDEVGGRAPAPVMSPQAPAQTQQSPWATPRNQFDRTRQPQQLVGGGDFDQAMAALQLLKVV